MSAQPTKNIDELLQKFVSTDEHRPKFMHPWREDNQVFASETRILIRVCRSLTKEDYQQYNDSNTNELFSAGEPDAVIRLDELARAISQAPLVDEMKCVGEDIGCEECYGTGKVYWDYRTWSRKFACPACDGSGYSSFHHYEPTGRKVIDEEAGVRIGNRVFRAYFLNMLLEAMKFCDCTEATITFGARTFAAARFNLTDKIDILIMPTAQEEFYTAIKLCKPA